MGNNDKLKVGLCFAGLDNRMQRLGQGFDCVSIEIRRGFIKSNKLYDLLVRAKAGEKGERTPH